VLAFEPTAHFRTVLERNVETNGLANVEIYPFGLSDRSARKTIQIGESSATLHPPGNAALCSREEIELVSLDEIQDRLALDRLDFIKVDVDGHEPHFLSGAQRVLAELAPPVLFEVSHLHYLEAGCTAWGFYRELKRQGYHIYDEAGLEEIASEAQFLIRCGNFHESRNVVISRKPLPAADEEGRR
jgi:FkbM family methyltransferase